MNRRRATTAGAALIAAIGLVGCGGDSSGGGRFVAAERAAYPLPCLEHQGDSPGQAYTGDAEGNTSAVFEVLEYYTANKGVRMFCDGDGPTETDRKWAQLYVDLGADRANVDHILIGARMP